MQLIERVAFDEPNNAPDGYGGREQGWTEVYSCRAEFIYSRGSEAVDAARLQGKAIYKVRVRSCAAARAVTADYRMRDARRGLPAGVEGDVLPGLRYQIREVDAITDRQWVYIVVEAGAAN
jgi:head-tail adaptor